MILKIFNFIIHITQFSKEAYNSKHFIEGEKNSLICRRKITYSKCFKIIEKICELFNDIIYKIISKVTYKLRNFNFFPS